MTSLQQVADQERAASAWGAIEAVIAKAQEIGQQVEQERLKKGEAPSEAQEKGQKATESFKKSYSGLTRSTPALVQTNGLGQTLAFLRAKAKGDRNTAHWLLYSHISQWIASRVDFGDKGPDGLLEWLVTQSSEVYRQTTAEVIAYLGWLKRFAEAELPEPEEVE
jgi:CRISPR-associated protein Cmr5